LGEADPENCANEIYLRQEGDPEMFKLLMGVMGLASFLSLSACQPSDSRAATGSPIEVRDGGEVRVSEPIQPIPLKMELDARKVELGEKLFHDRQLSHDDSISCASCHDLSRGGVDGLVRPVGINNAVGDINSPTVFNSGFNFRQFWNGRAATLEAQIDGPVHADKEMASNWKEVIGKLSQSPEYVASFTNLYQSKITEAGIKDAIATFERSLFTPNATFDRYLRGDHNALTLEESEGYTLFKEYGCVACHQGVNVGGNMFQKFGVMARGLDNPDRAGDDEGLMKVPSLRNIALTAPYFHNGSADTLEKAVSTMATQQLGRVLSSNEVDLIVKFLKSLTGEYKGAKL
jgi:cytochrome c peroxidase